MTRTAILVTLVLACASRAGADDRSACKAGDNQSCARIGQLKQAGALTAEGKKDTSKLLAACAVAVDAAKDGSSFRLVSSRCRQLFSPALAKSYDALGVGMSGADLTALLEYAYAEAYCPVFAEKNLKVVGCNGKKHVSSISPAQMVPTITALNAAALRVEHGEAAEPLVKKFDTKWPALLR